MKKNIVTGIIFITPIVLLIILFKPTDTQLIPESNEIIEEYEEESQAEITYEELWMPPIFLKKLNLFQKILKKNELKDY